MKPGRARSLCRHEGKRATHVIVQLWHLSAAVCWMVDPGGNGLHAWGQRVVRVAILLCDMLVTDKTAIRVRWNRRSWPLSFWHWPITALRPLHAMIACSVPLYQPITYPMHLHACLSYIDAVQNLTRTTPHRTHRPTSARSEAD